MSFLATDNLKRGSEAFVKNTPAELENKRAFSSI